VAMAWAMPIAVDRDAWVWAQYGLSVTAAITGIIVFLSWAAQWRRRPEILLRWWFSLDGDPGALGQLAARLRP
jgi:hypothetical protein